MSERNHLREIPDLHSVSWPSPVVSATDDQLATVKSGWSEAVNKNSSRDNYVSKWNKLTQQECLQQGEDPVSTGQSEQSEGTEGEALSSSVHPLDIFPGEPVARLPMTRHVPPVPNGQVSSLLPTQEEGTDWPGHNNWDASRPEEQQEVEAQYVRENDEAPGLEATSEQDNLSGQGKMEAKLWGHARKDRNSIVGGVWSDRILVGKDAAVLFHGRKLEDVLRSRVGDQRPQEVLGLDLSSSTSEPVKLKAMVDLSVFMSLESLDLNGNSIFRIENLMAFSKLRELKIARNNLKAIDNIWHLHNLAVLDLAGNFITKIPTQIRELSLLEYLDLSGNNLLVIRDIQHLTPLKNLVQCNLNTNPIAKLPQYREFAIFHLNSLEILDGENVTKENRRLALQRFGKSFTQEQLEQARKSEMAKIANAEEQTQKLYEENLKLRNMLIVKSQLLDNKSKQWQDATSQLYQLEQEVAFMRIDSGSNSNQSRTQPFVMQSPQVARLKGSLALGPGSTSSSPRSSVSTVYSPGASPVASPAGSIGSETRLSFDMSTPDLMRQNSFSSAQGFYSQPPQQQVIYVVNPLSPLQAQQQMSPRMSPSSARPSDERGYHTGVGIVIAGGSGNAGASMGTNAGEIRTHQGRQSEERFSVDESRNSESSFGSLTQSTHNHQFRSHSQSEFSGPSRLMTPREERTNISKHRRTVSGGSTSSGRARGFQGQRTSGTMIYEDIVTCNAYEELPSLARDRDRAHEELPSLARDRDRAQAANQAVKSQAQSKEANAQEISTDHGKTATSRPPLQPSSGQTKSQASQTSRPPQQKQTPPMQQQTKVAAPGKQIRSSTHPQSHNSEKKSALTRAPPTLQRSATSERLVSKASDKQTTPTLQRSSSSRLADRSSNSAPRTTLLDSHTSRRPLLPHPTRTPSTTADADVRKRTTERAAQSAARESSSSPVGRFVSSLSAQPASPTIVASPTYASSVVEEDPAEDNVQKLHKTILNLQQQYKGLQQKMLYLQRQQQQLREKITDGKGRLETTRMAILRINQQADGVAKELKGKVPQIDIEMELSLESLKKELVGRLETADRLRLRQGILKKKMSRIQESLVSRTESLVMSAGRHKDAQQFSVFDDSITMLTQQLQSSQDELIDVNSSLEQCQRDISELEAQVLVIESSKDEEKIRRETKMASRGRREDRGSEEVNPRDIIKKSLDEWERRRVAEEIIQGEMGQSGESVLGLLSGNTDEQRGAGTLLRFAGEEGESFYRRIMLRLRNLKVCEEGQLTDVSELQKELTAVMDAIREVENLQLRLQTDIARLEAESQRQKNEALSGLLNEQDHLISVQRDSLITAQAHARQEQLEREREYAAVAHRQEPLDESPTSSPHSLQYRTSGHDPMRERERVMVELRATAQDTKIPTPRSRGPQSQNDRASYIPPPTSNAGQTGPQGSKYQRGAPNRPDPINTSDSYPPTPNYPPPQQAHPPMGSTYGFMSPSAAVFASPVGYYAPVVPAGMQGGPVAVNTGLPGPFQQPHPMGSPSFIQAPNFPMFVPGIQVQQGSYQFIPQQPAAGAVPPSDSTTPNLAANQSSAPVFRASEGTAAKSDNREMSASSNEESTEANYRQKIDRRRSSSHSARVNRHKATPLTTRHRSARILSRRPHVSPRRVRSKSTEKDKDLDIALLHQRADESVHLMGDIRGQLKEQRERQNELEQRVKELDAIQSKAESELLRFEEEELRASKTEVDRLYNEWQERQKEWELRKSNKTLPKVSGPARSPNNNASSAVEVGVNTDTVILLSLAENEALLERSDLTGIGNTPRENSFRLVSSTSYESQTLEERKSPSGGSQVHGHFESRQSPATQIRSHGAETQSKTPANPGRLEVTVLSARDLPSVKRLFGKADPYVLLEIDPPQALGASEQPLKRGRSSRQLNSRDRIDGAHIYRTETRYDDLYPQWNQSFVISPLHTHMAKLHVMVFQDSRSGRDELIAETFIETADLQDQKRRAEWFPLHIPIQHQLGSRTKLPVHCAIRLKLRYVESGKPPLPESKRPPPLKVGSSRSLYSHLTESPESSIKEYNSASTAPPKPSRSPHEYAEESLDEKYLSPQPFSVGDDINQPQSDALSASSIPTPLWVDRARQHERPAHQDLLSDSLRDPERSPNLDETFPSRAVRRGGEKMRLSDMARTGSATKSYPPYRTSKPSSPAYRRGRLGVEECFDPDSLHHPQHRLLYESKRRPSPYVFRDHPIITQKRPDLGIFKSPFKSRPSEAGTAKLPDRYIGLNHLQSEYLKQLYKNWS